MPMIKCFFIGDATVGKTALITSFAANQFAYEYRPTIYDKYVATVDLKDERYILALYASHDSSKNIKQQSHLLLYSEQADVYLLCFSVVQPKSFKNLERRWIKELMRFAKDKPFIIVGTQIDLRGNTENKHKKITVRQGQRLAAKLSAFKYVECSALTQEGIQNVFEAAILATMQSPIVEEEKGYNRDYKYCTVL